MSGTGDSCRLRFRIVLSNKEKKQEMSKVFSISMATVLVLMSLVGQMQPTSVMAAAPQDLHPMAEGMPLDDTTDSEDVLTKEEETTELPPADDEIVTGDDDDLTQLEEPAENANAPPADEEPVIEKELVVEDEPVVEQEPVVEEDVVENEQPKVQEVEVGDTENTTVESEDMLISPSAVDPNPGDCPVGEICDGGGGGEIPAEVNVSLVSFIGTYYFPDAVFTITDGTTTKTVTADQYGWASTKLTSGVTYTISVLVGGYGTAAPVSITPTEPNNTYSFELTPIEVETYSVTFEIKDAVTGLPVADTDVRVTFESTGFNASNGYTDLNGAWTSRELRAGNYRAVVALSDDRYESARGINLTLPVSGPIQVELQPVSKSPISLKFVDADTGEPLDGVYFELAKEGHGTDVDAYSSASGEYTTESLEHGNYGLNAMKDGYGYVTDFRWDHPAGDTVVIEMEPFADGSLTFKLVDDQTGDPLPNAYITIFQGNFGEEIISAQTDENGEWTTPELPGGFYAAAIYPVNHHSVSFTFTVTSGNHPVTLELSEFNDVGYLNVHVLDVTYGYDVEDVKITVKEKDMGIVASGLTDQDGMWNVPYLPAGMYVVTFERNGYATEVIEFGKNDGDYHLDIEMHRLGQWKFRFWLRLPTYKYPDRITYIAQPALSTSNGLMPIAMQTEVEYVPVVGASVQLLNPDTLEVVAETISGEDGFVDLGNVTEGNYILQITGDGFEDYFEPVSITEDIEFQLDLTPSEAADPGEGEDDGENGPGTTVPDTGTPDDSTTPGTDAPDNGTTPDTGDPGTNNPDNGSNPGTGTPDEGTSPVPGDVESEQPANTDNDNDVAESEASVDAEAVAQSSGTSSDASTSGVNQLPNTGTGESQSHPALAALTLVAAFTLLGALGVRRTSR